MRCQSERGAVLIWVTLAATLMFALAAIVINAGHGTAVKGQLQNASDAAALAGATDLARNTDTSGHVTDAGMTNATATARTVSALHLTDTANTTGASSVTIPASAVSYGQWVSGTRTFTPTANLSLINAIQVTTSRTVAAGSALTVFMPSFVGSAGTSDVSSVAIAAVGGRCNLTCDGLVPIVISDCSRASLCGQRNIFLKDAGGTGEYWTSFNNGNSASVIRNIINGSLCDPNDPNAGPRTSVGSCTNDVPTGVRATDLQAIRDGHYCLAPSGSTCSATADKPVIPVICANTTACPSSFEVISFITISLKSVVATGSNKGITFDISCGADSGNSTSPGTCGTVGTIFTRPVLVR